METGIVTLINNCLHAVTIYLRYKRPKRGIDTRPRFFSLDPGAKSKPLPSRLLIGARGWTELERRGCVHLKSVPFDPRHVRLLNKSRSSLDLVVRIPRPRAPTRTAKITLEPGEKSRLVDVKLLRKQKAFKNLVATKRLAIVPVFDIGPAGEARGATGWYEGDDVYTCYDCGGPIVFRGSPPTPVHI
jgi:hypothetical protein